MANCNHKVVDNPFTICCCYFFTFFSLFMFFIFNATNKVNEISNIFLFQALLILFIVQSAYLGVHCG